jgi:hypothetical protein
VLNYSALFTNLFSKGRPGMLGNYIESYLIHEFSSNFCMILSWGKFATRPHPAPPSVYVLPVSTIPKFTRKIIVPFQTRLSLAWFQIRAPKTKKEYSVVTPVSGNPRTGFPIVIILRIVENEYDSCVLIGSRLGTG